MSATPPENPALPESGQPPWRRWLFPATVGLAIFLTWLLLTERFTIHDEVYHFSQVLRFLRWPPTLEPVLTTIPGFEAALAAVGRVVGTHSLLLYRWLSLLIWLGTLLIFARLIRDDQGRVDPALFAVFAFCPIIYIYGFLLYSDIPSLLTVLASLLALRLKRPGLAGLLALVSVTMRQTNIIWAAFFTSLLYIEDHGLDLRWRELVPFLKKAWAFELTAAAFVVFVVVNGGVAVGDSGMHPGNSLHIGNVMFGLFVYFICFLPENLWRAKEVFRTFFGTRRRAFLTCAGLLFSCRLYMLLWKPRHPYNKVMGFVRNVALFYREFSLWHRLGFFAMCAWAVMVIATHRMKRREYHLLWLFTLLVLLPAWLIEQRYYIVPFALMLLLREPMPRREALATAIWGALLSALVVYGTWSGEFFL